MDSLSPAALKVITDYQNLPFKQGGVVCPYYNNERVKMRGGLRVLIGKGSPQDIIEESLIISLHDKINLDDLSPEAAKKFLVDHRLGVDCSALVYYVIDAELKNRGKRRLGATLSFPLATNPLRKLLTILRPAENAGVATFAHQANSQAVELKNLRPGDLIIMKNTGAKRTLQHILLVHAIEKESNQLKTIHYAHSFAWSTEGRYGHGVRQGKISINNIVDPILKQTWTEKSLTGQDNETFTHAEQAEKLEIRRLHCLA